MTSSLPGPVQRRRYDSPVRRQRAEETRRRIVDRGADLVRGFESWTWEGLTFKAVAEAACVGERTVYRHFPTERQLREAVMRRLEEQAGVDYDALRLDTLVEVTQQVFGSLSAFRAAPLAGRGAPPDIDDAVRSSDRRRHESVRRAVSESTQGWPERQQLMAAAVLDALWQVPTYQSLVTDWTLTDDEASRSLTWALGLVVEAVSQDRRP